MSGDGPVIIVYTASSVMPLEIAADLGDHRVVFAYDPELTPAPVRELLDLIAPTVDLSDRTAAVAALAAMAPSGIVTFSDQDLPRTAELAAELGLAFHTPDAVRSTVDKYRQRRALSAAGLPVPRFHELTCCEEPPGMLTDRVVRAVAEVGTPAVLKPTFGAGSRDTYPIRSAEEAVECIRAVFSSGRARSVILEQLLVGDPQVAGTDFGDYVSVELLLWDGSPLFADITGRLPLIPPFREGGFVLPATIGSDHRRQCIEVALAACRAVGLRDGWTHTEIKLTAQGPAIIEVNGRLGGYVALLMRRAAGIGAVGLALDVAAGRPRPVPAMSYVRTAYAVHIMPPMEAARLTSFGDITRLNTHPDVDTVILVSRPGAPVDWRRGSDCLLGLVEGTADDHEAVVAVVRDIQACVARELEFA